MRKLRKKKLILHQNTVTQQKLFKNIILSKDPKIYFPISANTEISETDSSIIISRRWFNPLFRFLFVLGILWCSICGILFYLIVLKMSNEVSFYVFNGFLTIIGLAITYISWCGLKNHTEIIFDQFVMNITFKPYFWLGKTKVINQNIKEFFLIKKNNKQQNKQDNKQNFHYDLYVLLVNKEEIMLISSIQDFEIASEILEKLLKITQISQ